MIEADAGERVALAIGAHPDDIEFSMAGTLLKLGAAGFRVHYFNLSSGNCGSAVLDGQKTALVRAAEAKRAAGVLGAVWHPPVSRDLEIVYSVDLLRRVAATVRRVNPTVVLTHPPQDYMEDHVNTCRLAVTAAFGKGMPNFLSEPPVSAAAGPVTVYHCMPHGLRDPLRRKVVAGAFVDTTDVYEQKCAALAEHASQGDWLDRTQGIASPVETMTRFSEEMGKASGSFRHCEGWRRRLHYGFSDRDRDPLLEELGESYRVNPGYEADLG
jgi:LmbE family N-acetylglucosaminyl deacetylase